MTRSEFDEFKKLLSVGISTIYEAFDFIDSDREETVEIVPDMKWFLRSKTEIIYQLLESKKQGYTHSYLMHNSVRHISYEPLFKDELEKAIKFDTKEEAEQWTNPLTKAVQLPAEGE